MDVDNSGNQSDPNDQSSSQSPGQDFSMNSAYAASNLNTSRTFQPHSRDPRVSNITFQLNRKPPETLDLEKDDKISGSKLHKWMK
jgi:hypothetical protein